LNKLAKILGPLAVVFAVSLSHAPAHAQFGGFGGGGGGGGDMMTTMEPMLEMMKKKMGKKRFAQLMQTVGPMATQMMDGGGGFNINSIGGGFGAGGYGAGGYGLGGYGTGGFDMGTMTQFISPAMISSMVAMGSPSRRGTRKARRSE